MNKCIIFINFLIIFLISFNSSAHNATINIKAKLVEGTCEIEAANKVIDVDMGTGDAKGVQLLRPFGFKNFSIKLINCPESVNSAVVHFSSLDTGANDSKVYVNNQISRTAGGAGGFYLGIFDTQNNLIDLNTDNRISIPIGTGVQSIELKFRAAFIKYQDDYCYGNFKGSASFGIAYE